MKNKILIILILSITSCEQDRITYCGKVKYKYQTQAGYKVSEEKHVVFRSDSLKRFIDVAVTNNTYANIDTLHHEIVCFKLSDWELNK